MKNNIFIALGQRYNSILKQSLKHEESFLKLRAVSKEKDLEVYRNLSSEQLEQMVEIICMIGCNAKRAWELSEYKSMYQSKNEKLKYNDDEREREHKEIQKTILKNMSWFEKTLYNIGFKKMAVKKFKTDVQNIDDLMHKVGGYIKIIRIYKSNKLIHKFISVYKI